MPDQAQCPLCSAAPVSTESVGDSLSVDCPHCGNFSISGSALAELPTVIGTDRRKATLVGYVLRRMKRTAERPLLTSHSVRRILEKEKLPTPDIQADNLVKWLGDHSPQGEVVTISPGTHGAIVGFTDTPGIHLVLGGLKDAGLIKWYGVSGPTQHVELTMRGWVQHKELSTSGSPNHRLAAILDTDIVGFSRLMAEDERATLSAVAASMSTLQEIVERNGGRLIKETGDGTLSEFGSTVGAMQAAIEVQNALAQENMGKPEDRRIMLRMGLTVGDVSPDGDDIMGDAVNLAARLEATATPGTICVPAHVRDDLANKLPLVFEDLGQRELKGIARPVRVVRVTPR